jgi:hypothetical protein
MVTQHGQNLEEKSLTICSGTDYVNINYQHVICPDPETAKVTLPSFSVRETSLSEIAKYAILYQY